MYAALLLLAALLALAPGSPAPRAALARGVAGAWTAPLDGPLDVRRPFAPPATRWGAGHRGVDLAAPAGAVVRAAGAGTVSYAGDLAGRGVLAVRHGALRTTYEPVSPLVEPGTHVARGTPVATLASGHGGTSPPSARLHWGLLRGDTYLDPLLLLRRGPSRLVPVAPALPPAGAAAAAAGARGLDATVPPAAAPAIPPSRPAAAPRAVPPSRATPRRAAPLAPLAATAPVATAAAAAAGAAAVAALGSARRHRRAPRSRGSPRAPAEPPADAARPTAMRTHRIVPLAVGLAVAAAGCASPGRAASAGAADAPLAGTEWQLVAFPRGGTQVPAVGDSVLRLGDGQYSATACNHVLGDATVSGDTVVFEPGPSTLMMCHGHEDDVQTGVGAVLRGRVSWEVKGSRLWLRSPDAGTLVYEVRDSIYPTRNAHALLQGERDGWQYRLAALVDAGGGGLVFEARRGPGHAWGTGATGAPGPGEKALWAFAGGDVADVYLLGGFAPRGAARVTHRVTGDAPELEVAIHRVAGARWDYFGGFVAGHSRHSVVTIYGADGRILETSGP